MAKLKWLCVALALAWLSIGLASAESVTTADPGTDTAKEDLQTKAAKVEDLRGEISLTNLANGLNLTEEQLNQLISISKEVQALRESYKGLADECMKAFADLKSALIEYGPNIPPKVGQKAGELNDRAKELQEKFQAELPPFQDKVEKILTEAQKEVINTFKPCLLPPKNQKDPVRAGQASSHEVAINILRRVRGIPNSVYEEKRVQIMEKWFKKFEEKHGSLTDEEKAKEQARLFGLVDEARAMSDEEFELNKEELAQDFEIKDLRDQLSEQLKTLTEYREKDKPRMNKIGKFFLNPKMGGVLEAKLTVLKNFKPLPPKDLDKESPKGNAEKKGN